MFHRRRRFAFEPLETRLALSAVSIPVDLTAAPSEQVAVPVEITGAEDVRAVEIEINYDTGLLDADSDSITAGSVWTGGTVEVVASVDDQTGRIVASVFAAEGLDLDSGSLLSIAFTVSSDATPGDSTEIDLAEVVINEGEIAVDPEPQPGDDDTDGRITLVATQTSGTISGRVYADTNRSDQYDQLEAIAGVRIVLVNEESGEQTEVRTDDEGAYEFLDLPAGSYTIQEQQPAAFLDGGTNEVSVTLADGESLAQQDFQELGLKPQYVFNRLLTTLAMPQGSTQWAETVAEIIESAGTETDSAETSTSQTGTVQATSATAAVTLALASDDTEDLATAAVAAASAPTDSVSASETEAAATPVSVSIPDDLTGLPSGQVVVPVQIDHAEGVRRVEITISYDPTLLDAEPDAAQAGLVWPDTTELTAHVDNEAGWIHVILFSTEELQSGSGTLLEIEFTLCSDAPTGAFAEIDLVAVVLNEGDAEVEGSGGLVAVVGV